jgi:cold shock CspA family protein
MTDRLLGRVKWFNNRAGFGFVTVLDGDKKDDDVFVHHTGVNVSTEQYKYLVQGEYVSFTLRESENEEHPWQAGDVTGVLGGKLMCETRMENKRESNDDAGGRDADGSRPRRNYNGPRGGRSGGRNGGPRGSRAGYNEGDTFVLMRQSGSRRAQSNDSN